MKDTENVGTLETNLTPNDAKELGIDIQNINDLEDMNEIDFDAD